MAMPWEEDYGVMPWDENYQGDAPARFKITPEFQQQSAETLHRGQNPAQSIAADVAAGASGLMRGGANLVGGMFGKEKLGEDLWPSGLSRDTGYKMGGTLLDPVALAVGGTAFKGASMIPKIGKITQSVLGGMGTGGVIGGLSEEGTVGSGAAIGAGLGLALPVAIMGGSYIGKSVGQIADLITPGGSKRIADKYVNVIIGENNKESLARALKESPELVYGSKPTASEAVAHLPSGSPIQGHQSIVSKEAGGISAQFGQRAAEQQAAGKAQLAFAGTDDQIQNLMTARSNAVKPLYEAVETSIAEVNSLPALTRVNRILKTNKNRDSITLPLTKIKNDLASVTDEGIILEKSPQALKSLSDNISDMMGKKSPSGQNEFDVAALSEIKTLLDKHIGIAEPSFAQAQKVFADMSKPINKMQLGQKLKEKLTTPIGTESPGTYLRALENESKLLKEATGFSRGDIKKILTRDELDGIESLAADLERKALSMRPLQKTDLRGGVNVAGETTVSIPQLLSRPAMIVNYVLKSLGRNVEPEIDAYLARMYLNPKELGKMLSAAPKADRSKFNKLVQSYGKSIAINLTQQEEE